jgi:NADPH:quinone reductase-like Zn-dependent oxidoreductase
LLVRVTAISVNLVDHKSAAGEVAGNEPAYPSCDVAEVIVATGNAVVHFKIGYEVYCAGD